MASYAAKRGKAVVASACLTTFSQAFPHDAVQRKLDVLGQPGPRGRSVWICVPCNAVDDVSVSAHIARKRSTLSLEGGHIDPCCGERVPASW